MYVCVCVCVCVRACVCVCVCVRARTFLRPSFFFVSFLFAFLRFISVCIVSFWRVEILLVVVAFCCAAFPSFVRGCPRGEWRVTQSTALEGTKSFVLEHNHSIDSMSSQPFERFVPEHGRLSALR